MQDRERQLDSLVIFQAGDVRQAWARFKAGKAETYLDQRRSVGFLMELAQTRPVTVVCMSDEPHDETIDSELRSVGVSYSSYFKPGFAASILSKVQPGIAIAAIPHPDLLSSLERADIPTFVCLADVLRPVRTSEIASRDGLRRMRLNYRLRRLLQRKAFTALGNHSLSASRSLHSVLKLPADRIIPWEWSRLEPDPDAKLRRAGGPLRLFSAGMLIKSKGVGDLLEAAAILLNQGIDVHIDIAGRGDDQALFEARSRHADLAGKVSFLGLIPNDEVRSRMRAADAVVVPSRHSYAEGLPNAIFEALASRTPLVVSDHPAYKDRLKHGSDALIFDAGQPASLAAELVRLTRTEELYFRLSENSADALSKLYVGASWYDMVTSFVHDPRNTTGWVAQNSLEGLERRLARARDE